MSHKRIKNKRIENNAEYPILLHSDLDPNKLQDHVQASLNTGMEDEEKEELHLKNILTKNEGSIITPRIIKIDENANETEISDKYNLNSSFIFKKSREFLKYEDDCKNEYILSPEDYDFINKMNINEEYFLNELEKLREENEKMMKVKPSNAALDKSVDSVIMEEDTTTKTIKKYIQKRILLLYDQNGDFNSYGCFRKRILKAGRKSRRSDSYCIEKMKRMLTEVLILEKLFELTKEKYNEEAAMNLLKGDIVNYGKSAIINYQEKNKSKSYIKRKIINPITGVKVEAVKVPFYKKVKFDDLISDKKKINQLKSIMFGKKPTDEDIKNDIKFMNYFDLL